MRNKKRPEEYRDEVPLGNSFQDKTRNKQVQEPKDEKKISEEKEVVSSEPKIEEVGGEVVNPTKEELEEIPHIPNVSNGKVEEEKKKQDKTRQKKQLSEQERIEFAKENESSFNDALTQYSLMVLKQTPGVPPRMVDASKVIVPVKLNKIAIDFGSIGYAMAYHTADIGGSIAHRIQVWMEEHREIVGILMICGYGGWFHYQLMKANEVILEQERKEAVEKDKREREPVG